MFGSGKFVGNLGRRSGSLFISRVTSRQGKSGFRFFSNNGDGAGKSNPMWWWTSAQFWGGAGAIAGWGMTGAAIWDASNNGPEIISLKMTGVMLVYSSLFARWAWIVKPQNLLLSACHVSNVLAQANQMRRGVTYKIEQGEKEEVYDTAKKAAFSAAGLGALVVASPVLQSTIVAAELGPLSAFAGAEAGPFTVHFWAPMSKWLISGASFIEYDRPTDKISISQYSALTATGLFFSRYAMLVSPINYLLCSVNIALFGSSAYHLTRKINADYIQKKDTKTDQ